MKKKIFKKLDKMCDKGVITSYGDTSYGEDGIVVNKKEINIEFISLSKKDKLYNKSEEQLKKYFEKKLKKKCIIFEYCKNTYSLIVKK